MTELAFMGADATIIRAIREMIFQMSLTNTVNILLLKVITVWREQ